MHFEQGNVCLKKFHFMEKVLGNIYSKHDSHLRLPGGVGSVNWNQEVKHNPTSTLSYINVLPNTKERKHPLPLQLLRVLTRTYYAGTAIFVLNDIPKKLILYLL